MATSTIVHPIQSERHTSECQCLSCQTNNTGYFTDWREETIELEITAGPMMLQFVYFQQDPIPRMVTLQSPNVEISIRRVGEYQKTQREK